jgi:hypothetical protein
LKSRQRFSFKTYVGYLSKASDAGSRFRPFNTEKLTAKSPAWMNTLQRCGTDTLGGIASWQPTLSKAEVRMKNSE